MYATLRPPWLPSTSFKNDKEFHEHWTAHFLVLGAHIMHFRSTTTVIISLFGVPDFDGDRLLFEFLIRGWGCVTEA